jgi:drug/metabolite transporter (DMT)-like permease
MEVKNATYPRRLANEPGNDNLRLDRRVRAALWFAGDDVVFWRCLIGALTLLVFIVLSRQPFSRLTRFTLALAVIGGAALVVNWLLLFAAYSRISIGMATVVYNTQPFMLVLMGMVLGERVSAVKWGWLLLAFGGVVILLSAS